MHYTYLLLHRYLLVPIYVGQSTSPWHRYRQHCHDTGKRTWGAAPWLLVIGAYRDKHSCDFHENLLVDHLLYRWRMPLRNIKLTRFDTPYRPLFWLAPMLRSIWLGKFGIVRKTR